MIQELQKYLQLKNPITQFFVFLCILLGVTLVDLLLYESSSSMRIAYLINLAIVMGSGILYVILNYYIFKFPNVNVANIGISAIIIYLVVHVTSPWWIYVLTMACMFLGKLLIRYKNLPVFNPAALGIVIAYLVTYALKAAGVTQQTLFESWWGADIQFTFAEKIPLLYVIPILLLPGFFIAAKRFNKLQHAVWYFFTYTFLYVLYLFGREGSISNVGEMLLSFATGSYLFLAFVMVTEPKTSPVQKDHQMFLGIAGGTLLLLFLHIFPAIFPWYRLEIPTVSALLTLNALTWVVKNRRL